MRLRAAIFDMDGTLIDSMPAWERALFRLAEDLGQTPDSRLWTETRAMTTRDTGAYMRDRYGLSQTPEQLAEMLEERVVPYYTHEAVPRPGVVEFLTLLRMEGVDMYVATATPRYLTEAALKCSKLDGFFRGVLTCQEAGAPKEHSPLVYEKAMTRLRSRKEDTVIFEDSLPALRTAKAAGFRVAGVYDATAENQQAEIQRISDYYVRDWTDFYQAGTL